MTTPKPQKLSHTITNHTITLFIKTTCRVRLNTHNKALSPTKPPKSTSSTIKKASEASPICFSH